MEVDLKTKIGAKFSALMDKTESIFDPGYLKDKFNKEYLFQEKFNPFLESLANEIKSLPQDKLIFYQIEYWVMRLDERIEKAKRKEKLSEIGSIFLTHRRNLKAELSKIRSDFMVIEVPVKEESESPNETSLAFKDIFTVLDWKKYIDALHEVDNPVIDSTYKFIGNPKKHKGVICSWIKELQSKGKIDKKYGRQQLAEVLNNEIQGLNLGKDGKTFDNVSIAYDTEYKGKLIRATNLLP